jgi:membrane fusion protein (multidrug efflux system)
MLKRRLFRTTAILGGGAALLTAVALGGCRDGKDAPAAPSQVEAVAAPAAATRPVQKTVAVCRETLRRYAPAVGSFRARQTTRLAAQVSGRVQEVLVDAGALVHEGQVLVRIDPTFFEIDVGQSEASVEASEGALASARVDVMDTEREMKRQLDLFEQGAGSAKERDDAVTAYNRAVANEAEKAGNLAEAQKRLERARQQLEETQVRAPYDGAITCRMVDPGQAAVSMVVTELLEIQEVGVLYLEFALPQELLGSVSVGTPLEFEVEGVPDGAGVGTVALVYPAIDDSTRSLRCRAIIENESRKYRPGLLVRVNVVLQEVKDALVVPRTALSQTASGWQALVAAEGQSTSRAVQVGLVTEKWAQILGGLAEGEQVVVGANGQS